MAVRAVAASVGLALWIAAAPAATADEVNLLETRLNLSLGTFINASSLDIRLDGAGGEQGTQVNWGSSFGDSDETRFRLDGLWRFGERHHLRFMYTDYSRSETATFDEDIEWGGETIPVGVDVRGELGFDIIAVAYEYAFLKRDNYELAASIGLHYAEFEASLRADVEIDNGTGGTVTEQRGDKASVDAPMPVFGLRGMWNIGKNFYLDGLVQYFTLSIDNIDGDILNYRAALTWQPRKYVGIGLGYDFFDVDVDVEKNSFRGSMEWEYSGPQIFFNVGF